MCNSREARSASSRPLEYTYLCYRNVLCVLFRRTRYNCNLGGRQARNLSPVEINQTIDLSAQKFSERIKRILEKYRTHISKQSCWVEFCTYRVGSLYALQSSETHEQFIQHFRKGKGNSNGHKTPLKSPPSSSGIKAGIGPNSNCSCARPFSSPISLSTPGADDTRSTPPAH